MKNICNKTREGGYAILFTVAIIGIISMITIGLSTTAFKQMILSSVARDSTTAFYQSDIASECALYADNETTTFEEGVEWSCAGYTLIYNKINENSYELNPKDENTINKCFRISVTKEDINDTIVTKVEAKGYNVCNKGNMRTVERGIKITY